MNVPPLAILVHTVGLPINGDDPVGESLGGSETAVVSMARALARRGHRVTVACTTDVPRTVAGVEYLSAADLALQRVPRRFDLFLSARDPAALWRAPPAGMYGLWHHDMPAPEIIEPLTLTLGRASFSFFLSRFHREAYDELLPGLRDHAVLTRNGIDFEAVESVLAEVPSEAPPGPRFVFGSRPERGLHVLLTALWPRLRERLPTAELLISTYDDDLISPPLRAHRHECEHLARLLPGVRWLGTLTRREFWHTMATCRAVLYPTDFPEISCMVAAEAQALGVPVVTTDRFALPETVACRDTLVAAEWGSPAYAEHFIEVAVRLAEDPEFYHETCRTGFEHVTRERFGWDAIAESWESFLHDRFHERLRRRKAGVLRRLLRDADVVASRRLVSGGSLEAFDPADLADLEQRAEFHRDDGAAAVPEGQPFARALSRRLDNETPGIVLDVGGMVGDTWTPDGVAHPELVTIEVGRPAAAPPEPGPLTCDVALLAWVLELSQDPAALLEWAESRARRAVVGCVVQGPWEAHCGRRGQLSHIEEQDLRELLDGKAESQMEYIHQGITMRGEELGCWVFSYAVDESNRPGALDLDRKILRTAPSAKVSATLIVRNEEAHIRRAIEGLAPIVDEILVGDTGSSDTTVAILKSMGFRGLREARETHGRRIVEPVVFEDFAQARNAVAELATGDYLYWQDADEILVEGPVLRNFVDPNEHLDGFAIEQRHLAFDTEIESQYPLRCFRTQASEGSLRWFGCIHETVEYNLNEPPRKIVRLPGIYLAHLGYMLEKDRVYKSLERNWPLLLEDRRRNPERWLGYFNGLREYVYLAEWELKVAGRMTAKAYHNLNYGYELWRRHVEPRPEIRDLGTSLAQRILEILAQHELPLRSCGRIPFQVDLALEMAPLETASATAADPARRRFFANLDEVREELERRLGDLERQVPAPLPDGEAAAFSVRQIPDLARWTLDPAAFDLEPFEDGEMPED